MAQIDMKNFEKLNKQRNLLHDKVYATYSTFDLLGKHYVQIDTYGRSDRDNPGKISQSVQFDRESAKIMYDILKKEFNF